MNAFATSSADIVLPELKQQKLLVSVRYSTKLTVASKHWWKADRKAKLRMVGIFSRKSIILLIFSYALAYYFAQKQKEERPYIRRSWSGWETSNSPGRSRKRRRTTSSQNIDGQVPSWIFWKGWNEKISL